MVLIFTDNEILNKDLNKNIENSRVVYYPDYILEANKPNTAFVLKQIKKNNVKIQLILRLKTSTDCENYKNSIITFLKIEQKKWDKYLRNKKVLYRKE